MKKLFLSSLTLSFFMVFAIGVKSQTFNYGTGNISANPAGFNTAGTFAGYTIVGNDLTVTGSINMPAGTYNFANVTINAGATVTVPTGTAVPMIIRCTGSFVNNGDFRANGGNGANATNSATAAAAGQGCAGGTNGGVGGAQSGGGTHPAAFQTGGNGVNFGSSSGRGLRMCNPTTNNYPSWGGSGGGGGAYGTAGANGGNAIGVGTGCNTGGSGGSVYGSADLLTSAGAPAAFQSLGQTTAGDRWILGGSGGGGGGGTQSILTSARAAGGGGGGGGGAVQITANSITIGSGAWIRARGGNGGNGTVSTGGNAGGGGGGGGAGGTINLQYMSTYTNNGTLQVSGGIGGGGGFGTVGIGGVGGNGGSGRILVEQDVVLCTPPTVSASSFGSSSITTSSATISWTRGNGDQVLVIVREGAAVSGGPVSATSYTANSDFTLGDALGGGRVVYIGSGTSVNVTNLPNLNTTYHVAVFEFFTAGGGCYQNLASALTGTFITTNGPMTYVSSTNVQQTGSSPLGATNQPILRFEVVGGPGTAPALTVSSITFNTTGTTNVADLTGARFYYTGSSTTFSTATPFGSSVSNPSGTHVVSGSQTLMPGANYFWLVYDVSITATPGNVMDAQITSVNVGTAQTPSVTDPPGNRTITSLMNLSCGYTFTHFTPTWISNVGQPGTTVIASGAAAIDDQRWPGQSFAPGFTFEFNGTVYNSFGIHSKGFIWFGTTNPAGVFWTPISSTLGYEGAIAPFAFDMQAHSASTTTPQITVRYTGTAPNRVCIIEWTAMRPYANTGGICVPFGFPDDWNRYDFQLHLYENGGTNANRIEFVYRDMNPFCVNSNGASAQVGLRGPNNTDFLNRQGSGNNAHTSSAAGTLNNQVISHGANNFFNGNGGMRFTPTFQIPEITPSPTASNTCPSVTVNLNTSSPVVTKQWYKDNLPITGADASTYVADASGNYIVVVTQSGCSKVSDQVAVTINPCALTWVGGTIGNLNDWDTPSNWNPANVPTASDNVLIPSVTHLPIISNINAEVSDITIDAGASVTINADASLTVNGNLNNNGLFIVNSGASLVQTSTSTLSGSGQYQVIREINTGTALGHRFVGSPIQGAVAGSFGITATHLNPGNGTQIIPLATCDAASISPNSPWGTITRLNQSLTPIHNCSASLWEVIPSGTPLDNGMGYAMWLSLNQTLTFTGVVNNGNITLSGLGRQTGTINTPTGSTSFGWHLVSNPYPSPIKFIPNSFLPPQGFDAQIFKFQSTGGASGTWVAVDPTLEVEIPVGQAFQIRVTNPSTSNILTFTNNLRFAGNPSFLSTEHPSLYRMNIKTVRSDNTHSDVLLYFFDDATDSFDIMYDAVLMGSLPSSSQLYFPQNDIYNPKISINALAPITQYKEIPLNYRAGTNGIVNMIFEFVETLPAGMIVFLHDLKTGNVVNLREQNHYEFSALASDNESRFKLVFYPPLNANTIQANCENVGYISITPNGFDWTYNVQNDQGSVVAQGNLSSVQSELIQVEPGIYTVNIQLNNSTYADVISNIEVLGLIQPVADFSSNLTEVYQDEPVSFTNLSQNFSWLEWDFGDGNSSFVENPIHSYNFGGWFTVKLTAKSEDGCEDQKESNIWVKSQTLFLEDLDSNKWTVYAHANKIFVKIPENVDTKSLQYSLVGLDGRVNQMGNLSSDLHLVEIPTNLATGIYLIQIFDTNYLYLKRKLLIEK